MTRKELKAHNTGTAPSVTFKIGKPVIILEINAGFGALEFGGIKAALTKKRTEEDWDSYFASGVSVPSPGGDHASIFSWHGAKFWDGDRYDLAIVGAPQVSATLYADIVIDEEVEKYLAAGVSIGGAHFSWIAQGGKRVNNYETLGAVTEKKFTCPANRRWYWSGTLYAERDQNATLVISLHDASDNTLLTLDSYGAGTTNIDFPMDSAAAGLQRVINLFKNYLLEAGEYIKVTWGAAQTTPVVSCPVIEVPG